MIFISNELQYMGGLKNISKKPFKINSITSGTETSQYTAGTGKGLTFANPYITANQVQEIYNRIVGYEYFPCEVTWRGNPSSESGDIVKVEDINNNEFKAFVCNSTISLGGGVSATVESIGTTDAIIQFDNITPTEKKVIELQNSIRSQTELINGSNGGVFEIQDTNEDGVNDGWNLWTDGTHTKGIVARPTGIGLTSNGGVTYENAITHEGINAETLYTGKITGGKVVFDLDEGTLEIRSNDGLLKTMLSGDYPLSTWKKEGATWKQTSGTTPSGRTFTQSISNLEDSSWFAEMGVTGTGEQQGLSLTSATCPKYLQITESSGAVIFLDKNGKDRLQFGEDATFLKDENGTDRFLANENGTYVYDANKKARFFADATDTALWFGNNAIGVDATGAYKVINGTAYYL